MIRHSRRYFPRSFGLVIFSTFVAAGLCGCTPHPTTQPSGVQTLEEQCFSQGWTNHLPLQKGDTVKSMYVFDDSIHIMTAMNYDFAFKRASGDLLFYNPVATPTSDLHGGPVMLKDEIAFPTTFTIEVFSKKGRWKKSIPLTFTVTSGGVGADDMVYIGSAENNGEIAAVATDQPYNSVRWRLMAMGTVSSAPAIVGNNTYFASADGNVRAANENQETAWPLLAGQDGHFPTGGRIVADLKVDKTTVYIASTSARLYALNKDTGKMKWQYFAPQPLQVAPDITSTSVYQFVPKTGLVALNKSENQDLGPDVKEPVENPNHLPRWTAPDAIQFLAEDAKYTYVLRNDRHIVALDKKTGATAFESKRSDFAVFGTNTKDGTIFAATKAGLVMAIVPVLKPGMHGEIVMDFESSVTPVFASVR